MPHARAGARRSAQRTAAAGGARIEPARTLSAASVAACGSMFGGDDSGAPAAASPTGGGADSDRARRGSVGCERLHVQAALLAEREADRRRRAAARTRDHAALREPPAPAPVGIGGIGGMLRRHRRPASAAARRLATATHATGGGVANGPRGRHRRGGGLAIGPGGAICIGGATSGGGAAGRARAAPPQLRQNFMPGGFSPRHTLQMSGNPARRRRESARTTGASELPQFRQNDEPDGLSWPHIEQRIGPLTLNPHRVSQTSAAAGMAPGRFATPRAPC